ncbi:MAG: glutathione S-transferase family protein [Sphingomicrobium sp.]
MSNHLKLVSHPLCPYVQRAVVVMIEKQVAFERVDIDLADKPAWFLALSPTGKTPLLMVIRDGDTHALFESAAIVEYLDETCATPLMPGDPIERARSRAWIEFASATLADIAGLYAAPDVEAFAKRREALERRFVQIETALIGQWFAGEHFGLVDAAFAPVFRYLDAFERLAGLRLVDELVRLAQWRIALAKRPSVAAAVARDFPARLDRFLLARGSQLTRLILEHSLATAGTKPHHHPRPSRQSRKTPRHGQSLHPQSSQTLCPQSRSGSALP